MHPRKAARFAGETLPPAIDAGCHGRLAAYLARMLRYLAAAAFLASPAFSGQPGPDTADAFVADDADALWSRMTLDMQDALGNSAALSDLRASLGDETQVIAENTLTLNGLTTYQRLSEWTGTEDPLMLTIASDDAGQIAGFHIVPAPRLPTDDAVPVPVPVTGLRLPFDGEWLVFWGGDDLAHNYHAADPGQRYAADFVMADDGASFKGDPMKLDSYHCWDQPILAPAAGQVVAATADRPDQQIGETDADNPAGNHVVIEIAPDTYVFLAHLRHSSVTVAPGDPVEPGQKIGSCGNSGNTSEPHLHMHIQTEPALGQGTGRPAHFARYRADGAVIGDAAPLRGQTIAPAP